MKLGMKAEQKKENLEENLNKHPEIQEAVETMKRISAIDNKRARETFEHEPVYFPVG